MAQSNYISLLERLDSVANSEMGHIGRIMPPGNVAVVSHILPDVRVALRVFTNNRICALGPWKQNHEPLVVIRKKLVVRNQLKQVAVEDERTEIPPIGFSIDHAGNRATVFIISEST